jgi:hypothetical protein
MAPNKRLLSPASVWDLPVLLEAFRANNIKERHIYRLWRWVSTHLCVACSLVGLFVPTAAAAAAAAAATTAACMDELHCVARACSHELCRSE